VKPGIRLIAVAFQNAARSLFLSHLSLLLNIHLPLSFSSNIHLPGILHNDRLSVSPQVAHLPYHRADFHNGSL
jgi:hypothetical protein